MNKSLVYNSILRANHLSNANSVGSFNPAMLLRFNYGHSNLERLIISLHETTHARLSATVYGRTLFFLRFLVLDALAFWAFHEDTASFDKYWQGVTLINQIISDMVSQWVLSHEGAATFRDKIDLEKREGEDAQALLHTLNQIFTDPLSPYKAGYDIVKEISQAGATHYHLFGIIHEIANVDFLGIDKFNLDTVEAQLKRISPDHFLKQLAILFQEEQNHIFLHELPAYNYIEAIRKKLSQLGFTIFPHRTSQKMLDMLLAGASKNSPFPENYLSRIEMFRERQLSFDKIQKSYISTRLMFDAHRDIYGRTYVDNDPYPNPVQPVLMSEIQAMCDIDWLIHQYLPHDPEGFQRKITNDSAWFPEEHSFALIFNVFQ